MARWRDVSRAKARLTIKPGGRLPGASGAVSACARGWAVRTSGSQPSAGRYWANFSVRWIPLLPLYYLLVSLAAWLAMVEYVTRRFAWNKTAHGLARSSRYRQSRQPGS